MPRDHSRSRSRDRHKSRRDDSRERDRSSRKHSRSHGSSDRRREDRHDAKRSKHRSRSPDRTSQPAEHSELQHQRSLFTLIRRESAAPTLCFNGNPCCSKCVVLRSKPQNTTHANASVLTFAQGTVPSPAAGRRGRKEALAAGEARSVEGQAGSGNNCATTLCSTGAISCCAVQCGRHGEGGLVRPPRG